MLSALVLAPPFSTASTSAPGAVVRTLGALVPATVEGLVRDVVLLVQTGDDALRTVAEHAGCRLVEANAFRGGFAQALAAVKQPLVFAVRAGAAFDRGFLNEVAGLLGPERAGEDAPCFVLRQAPEGLAARLLPDLAPVAGLIAPSKRLACPATDFSGVVRGAGKARTLTSRAVMA